MSRASISTPILATHFGPFCRIPQLCSILLVLSTATPVIQAQAVLPDTRPLTFEGDPAASMVDAINVFLDRESAAAAGRRPLSTDGDIAARREKFRRLIGAVDPRVSSPDVQFLATTAGPAEIAKAKTYRVYAVRWPVFEDVDAEGLLLQPEVKAKARIVAIPDVDWSPEMLAGLSPGLEASAQFARRLAENGCQVLVPVLIDRGDTWSGIPGVRMTNQPHREWIYRMAYETGRHVIGYEVQKVLAAVDWFTRENEAYTVPIGVAGYGEGGLLALYAASLDTRIRAALVSGYFQPRQDVWREPIYRDVWGLLPEFGDAELAGMIAPCPVIVEASRFPEIAGPPAATRERQGAAPSGTITTPPLESVRAEAARAGGNIRLVVSGEGRGAPGFGEALTAFIGSLGAPIAQLAAADPPVTGRKVFDATDRLHRQFNQLVAHTQAVIRRSDRNRTAFWSRADASSPEAWKKTTQPMRKYIWEEVIGRLPDPSVPANPRTRLIFDEPKYRGYEVMLDVWPYSHTEFCWSRRRFAPARDGPWSSASTALKGACGTWRIRTSTRSLIIDSPSAWPRKGS